MSATIPAWRVWAVGLAIILSAILGYLGATFDGDASTVPDGKKTIEEVSRGVGYIKNSGPTVVEAPVEKSE